MFLFREIDNEIVKNELVKELIEINKNQSSTSHHKRSRNIKRISTCISTTVISVVPFGTDLPAFLTLSSKMGEKDYIDENPLCNALMRGEEFMNSIKSVEDDVE
ncbi:hypothetical protein PIROE2DRAFT_14341 [Piromyces sp. E2]|nr:hypothetical protein PIROE2DRAFT_14341 [Piromyces sp. E2]|eukprot:OUM60004.1 hypothetical protein PIROE2DRAFT_14341 [Piromyces sp. E2]